MIWAAVVAAWLAAATWCTWRLVPWGQRRYYIRHLGPGPVSRTWAIGLVAVAFVLAWPLYLWLWWRQGPKQEPASEDPGP